MEKFWSTVVAVIIVLIFVACMWWGVTPIGRAQWNNWWHDVQKADDATNYNTRRQVEEICRSTIISYESDKFLYEQYKDSEDEEQRGWAASAKIRANKAALTYNEYFLKNSYVFEGNVPADIYMKLELLE